METTQNETLDSVFTTQSKIRRRTLLPWWIKVFSWIFMLFGAVAPLGLIAGIFGARFDLSLYGFSTVEPMSATGLLLLGLFLLKGMTAFSLWTEKDWAIVLGQIDAVLGIVTCVFMMMVYPFMDGQEAFKFNFRLELILLIPFLIKLGNIKGRWEEINSPPASTTSP